MPCIVFLNSDHCFTGFTKIFEGIWGIIVGIAEGDNEKIRESVDILIQGIGQLLLGLIQTILGIGEMILGAIWGIIETIATWIYEHIILPVINWFKGLWDKIVTGVTTAVTKVKEKFNSIVTTLSTIWEKIKAKFKEIGTKIGETVGNAFKTVINGVLKAVEGVINTPIKGINKLIDVINKVPGINLGRLNLVELPRLAKGGIINQPGRGIAVGGERGHEGVIPLTDSQQMALLGEAIGRYITINATIQNTMNGRVISRELQKIQQENSFASNR